MAQENPFYYNLPVRPADFVGRWPLVDDIAADLCRGRPDSWAVIGGRRFGKSSVLKAVEARLLERLAGCGQGERHVFPLIVDLKGSETETEQNVYARIVRLLHRALARSQVLSLDLSQTALDAAHRSETLSFYDFEEVLDDLAGCFRRQCGPLRLVLLLDEVEATARFPWCETLFNQLRSLVYDGPLADTVRLVLTGSARVVQVRHEGSPLLNAVKIVHLASFPEAAMDELLARGGAISADAAQEVKAQSGGHPFIAQYLLHHLWDGGLAQATVAQVRGVAQRMCQERAADLRGWWEAIGEAGRQAYRLLAGSGGWMDESTLLAQVAGDAGPLDQGLVALCYHGLAVRDESGRRYRMAGALFRDWFLRNASPDLPLLLPSSLDHSRLQQLAEHIEQDLKLLKEYEDALRYEDDPRRKARYRREILQLRESAARYRREYEKLRGRITGAQGAMEDVADRLGQMDAKLDLLLEGQETIRDDLADMRLALLERFAAGEQALIAAFIDRLDQSQLETVAGVLEAIDKGAIPLSELEETLGAVQASLATLQKSGMKLPDELDSLSEAVDALRLDVRHRLKIAIPIIPWLLSYEGEIDLGSGLNLEKAWRRIVNRMRGKR